MSEAATQLMASIVTTVQCLTFTLHNCTKVPLSVVTHLVTLFKYAHCVFYISCWRADKPGKGAGMGTVTGSE